MDKSGAGVYSTNASSCGIVRDHFRKVNEEGGHIGGVNSRKTNYYPDNDLFIDHKLAVRYEKNSYSEETEVRRSCQQD